MHRLTVSQIFANHQQTPVTQNLSLSSIFFTNQSIYLTDTSNRKVLSKLSLNSFELTQEIQLFQKVYQKKIVSLAEINQLIVFAVQGQNDLYYINTKRQCIRLMSHMAKINQVILYNGKIATCSDDFTVRIWNQEKGYLVQSKIKHAFAGHGGKVTCLQTYQNILISGSTDKTVIFWQNDSILSKFTCNGTILNLLSCPQSDKLIIFTSNNQLLILSMKTLAKNKKPQFLQTIKYSPQKPNNPKSRCFMNCFQIDDSFILFRDGNQIIFVEINLGEIIRKEQLMENQGKNEILAVNVIGRVLVYGQKGGNLYLLRF